MLVEELKDSPTIPGEAGHCDSIMQRRVLAGALTQL